MRVAASQPADRPAAAMARDATEALADTKIAVDGRERAVTSAVVFQGLLARIKPAQAGVIHLVKLGGMAVAAGGGIQRHRARPRSCRCDLRRRSIVNQSG